MSWCHGVVMAQDGKECQIELGRNFGVPQLSGMSHALWMTPVSSWQCRANKIMEGSVLTIACSSLEFPRGHDDCIFSLSLLARHTRATFDDCISSLLGSHIGASFCDDISLLGTLVHDLAIASF
jgi:hypothetical protein